MRAHRKESEPEPAPPAGYERIYSGTLEKGDLCWNFSSWVEVGRFNDGPIGVEIEGAAFKVCRKTA